jgi:transcription-repair coupling factor (superfamily II helicase)
MFYGVSAQVKTIVQSGHFAPVNEITVHPYKRLGATTDGYKIKLWDLELGLECGEITLGYDRKLPISQLKFVNDSVDIVLSFVLNNRIIFKEVKSNKLIDIREFPLDEKIKVDEYDLLKLEYEDRNENRRSMRRYISEVEKLNERYESDWKEYLSKALTDGNYLSTNQHATFYVRYKDVAGSKSGFNKRFKSFKRRKRQLSDEYTPDSLGWEYGIFNIHKKKFKKHDIKVGLYKESFKGKRKLITEIPLRYVTTESRLKSIWMSPNENFSVLGNSLLYVADADRKMEKKTRRLVALLV